MALWQAISCFAKTACTGKQAEKAFNANGTNRDKEISMASESI